MKFTLDIRFRITELLLVLLCILNCISGRRYAEQSYYPQDYEDGQQKIEKIKTALTKLEHAPKWASEWPDQAIKMGQVSGVALDNSGQLLVFHRASNTWDETTFTERNVYQGIGKPAIPYPTVLVFNDTGALVDKWGEHLFHIPHGITVDTKGNVFVTDVALHQVFKFAAGKWKQPELVLGEKFVPGNDFSHFCKPSAVAVLPSGDFFIADGYCNHRILKLAPDGTIILHWGTSHGDSLFSFNVPHALTLAPDRGLVCVADRENGRVVCFRSDNGTYVASYSNWLIGGRLFSVAYAPVHGGRLYVVNGPTNDLVPVPVRGYVIDLTSSRLVQTFAPERGFSNPHDIVASPDGSKLYVAELNPHRVYKFEDLSLRNDSLVPTVAVSHNNTRAKPTATVEVSPPVTTVSGGWEWWWGAAGGAGGAAAAALLALAAAALRQARNKGKSYEAEPLVQ